MNNQSAMLKLGIPLKIINRKRSAVIKINKHGYLVVNFDDTGSFYISDISLTGWKPKNFFKYLLFMVIKKG